MGDEATGERRQGLVGALNQAVQRIDQISGVEGAMIASRDGLLVVSGRGVAEGLEMKAAVAAAVFGAIDRAAANIDLGPIRAALIETSDRSLQMLSLAELLLVVTAKKSANMAHIRTGMARAAEELVRQAGKAAPAA